MKNLGRKTVLALIISKIMILYAQAPDTTWTKIFDANPYDGVHSVQQTLDGGYVMFGETGVIEPTSTDAYIIKTDILGNTLWTRVFDIDSLDYLTDGLQSNDSSYFCVGYIVQYVSAQQIPRILLMKLNSEGDTLWVKIVDSMAVCYSMCQSVDSGYLLVGQKIVNIYSDLYLMKVNDIGDIIYTRSYGESNDDFGSSICAVNNDGYYILGSTKSFGNGLYDFWLLRTDANGDTIWTKTYGGNDIDYGAGLDVTPDGGCILGGHTRSYGSGGGDIWLIRTDSMGDTLWTKSFGGSGYDYGMHLQRTYDDGCIITGITESFGVDSSALYLIKTDANGTLLWDKIYDRPHYDYSTCVQQTADSGYIIAGHTFPASQTNDIWLLKMTTDTFAVLEQKTSHPQKKSYATIVRGPLLMPSNSQFIVYDITGRKIEPAKISTGIYFIRTERQNFIKIIVVK